MKFLKPALILLTILALTYTVSANKISFNKLTDRSTPTAPASLPVKGDLVFALTAIATLGGYMVFKK